MEINKNTLIENLLKSDTFTYTNKVIIDDIPIDLYIINNKKTITYKFENDDLILICKSYTKNATNLKKVFNEIEDIICNYKIFGSELHPKNTICFLQCFSDWIRKIKNIKNRPTCYVCLNYTKEYKTVCGHDICYSCYLKQIETKNTKCGICRKCLVCDGDCKIFCVNNEDNHIERGML
jgi:hypothetical protein